MGEEHKPRVEAGELAGEAGADAAADALVEIEETADALVERNGRGVPRDKARELIALAREVGEGERLDRWYRLAKVAGPKTTLAVLGGGEVAREGLGDVEAAIEQRRAERKQDDWGDGDARPQRHDRVPLFEAHGEKGTKPRPWLPGGVVGLVVARGGTGKTRFLAELAMAVAWADCGAVAPKVPPVALTDGARGAGAVLLFLAEEDNDGAGAAIWRGLLNTAGNQAEGLATDAKWPQRVRWWAGGSRSTALCNVVEVEEAGRGRVTRYVPTPLFAHLERHARELRPRLIVLDPVNQLLPAGASENDAAVAGAVVALAGRLRDAAEQGGEGAKKWTGPRPVVLLVHHESKAAASTGDAHAAARGSSAWVDNVRWVARLSRQWSAKKTFERINVAVVKSNYGPMMEHSGVVESNGSWRPWTMQDTTAWDTEAADAKKGKTEAADAKKGKAAQGEAAAPADNDTFFDGLD